MKYIANLALVLVAFGAAPLSAQEPTLTTQDYIDIEQLNARYAFAIDECRNNGSNYSRLYTEDGTFAVADKWGEPGRVFATGHEQLAAAAGGGPDGCRDPKTLMGYGISHVVVDQVIEPRPGGAYGRNKLIAMSIGGDPSKNEVQGGYEDFYVKGPEGWRFKTRVHVFPNMDQSLQFGPLRRQQAQEKGATTQ
jgi:hypothetical protein